MDKPTRQFVPAWLRAAMLSICLASSGCSQLAQHDPVLTDEFAHWGEKQRPAGPAGNLLGTSEESRQVERNLGVR